MGWDGLSGADGYMVGGLQSRGVQVTAVNITKMAFKIPHDFQDLSHEEQLTLLMKKVDSLALTWSGHSPAGKRWAVYVYDIGPDELEEARVVQSQINEILSKEPWLI